MELSTASRAPKVHTASSSAGTQEEVDDHPWVIHVKEQVLDGTRHMRNGGAGLTLKKVTPMLRRNNPTAYDPIMFTFGPYHATLKEGEYQDRIKALAIAHGMCEAVQTQERTLPELIEELTHKIMNRDREMRSLFKDESQKLRSMNAKTLAYLLAIDALSIVNYIYTRYLNVLVPVFSPFYVDVFLYENQIPLSLIADALEIGFGKEHIPQKLRGLVGNLLSVGSPFSEETEHLVVPSESEYENQTLLGCFYDSLTTTSRPSSTVSLLPLPDIPSASRLKSSGIKFRAGKGAFSAVRFEGKRTLVLPKIGVGDETETLLRNLLAYEVELKPRNSVVASYAYVMDFLINDEEDVQVLRNNGVIANLMGSNKQVADLFNGLTLGLTGDMTKEDKKILMQLNAASKRLFFPTFTRFFETYYEKKPWLLISVMAAIALLVLAILQTYYTMKPFFTSKLPTP